MSINNEQFMVLLEQVTKAASILKDELSESDRTAALKMCQGMSLSLEKPRNEVLKMAFSSSQLSCIRMGIDLDIFNALAQREEPISLEELASMKNTDHSLLERILRLLTGIGYVHESGPRLYSANDITRELTSRSSVGAIRGIFDILAPTWAKMPEYFRKNDFQISNSSNDGALQYTQQTKDPIWALFASSPQAQEDFQAFMAAGWGDKTRWVDWFPVQERLIDGAENSDENVLLVDVAGAGGHDVELFHEKFPNAPGRLVLEDQEFVLENADVGGDIERVPLDLFKAQPIQGARIYYMKRIMHDWSNSECLEILRHIRDASKKGYSKLIIEEVIMPATGAPVLATLLDLLMLVSTNTLERNEYQWHELLNSAGFRVIKIWTPPHDGMGIVEAEPIFDD